MWLLIGMNVSLAASFQSKKRGQSSRPCDGQTLETQRKLSSELERQTPPSLLLSAFQTQRNWFTTEKKKQSRTNFWRTHGCTQGFVYPAKQFWSQRNPTWLAARRVSSVSPELYSTAIIRPFAQEHYRNISAPFSSCVTSTGFPNTLMGTKLAKWKLANTVAESLSFWSDH